MPLPARQLSLRRAVIALAVVAVVAVVAVLAIGGHDTSGTRATESLARVAAPGPGWTAGGTGLDPGWEEDSVHQDRHGVWTGRDPEDDLGRYVVTWDHVVGAGQEQAACAQAAAWLRRTGAGLPGHRDGAADGVANPTPSAVAERCARALGRAAPGRTVDETFAVWQPGTRYAGYEFGAYLTFHGDAAHRTLVATAQAQQIQS